MKDWGSTHRDSGSLFFGGFGCPPLCLSWRHLAIIFSQLLACEPSIIPLPYLPVSPSASSLLWWHLEPGAESGLPAPTASQVFPIILILHNQTRGLRLFINLLSSHSAELWSDVKYLKRWFLEAVRSVRQIVSRSSSCDFSSHLRTLGNLGSRFQLLLPKTLSFHFTPKRLNNLQKWSNCNYFSYFNCNLLCH